MGEVGNPGKDLGLRVALQQITEELKESSVGEQVQRIADLASEYPHSIRLIQLAIASEPDSFAFNCHAYTFDIYRAPEFKRLYRAEVVPNGRFVAGLIGSLLHETSKPVQEDFVLYFENGLIKHSGIFLGNGRVRSKWGGAHTWEHALCEVPSGFGCIVHYYEHVPADPVLKAFLAYGARPQT